MIALIIIGILLVIGFVYWKSNEHLDAVAPVPKPDDSKKASDTNIIIVQPPDDDAYNPYWYGPGYGTYVYPDYYSGYNIGWQPGGFRRGYGQGWSHSRPRIAGPRFPGPTGHGGGHRGGHR